MKLFFHPSVTVYPENTFQVNRKSTILMYLNMCRAVDEDFITMSSHQINSLLICSVFLVFTIDFEHAFAC